MQKCRGAALIFLLVAACSSDEPGDGAEPSHDAGTTSDADASARDVTADAPAGHQPDVAIGDEPDVVPTSDAPDVGGEPAVDGDREDLGNTDDGRFDIADVGSEMDRNADRCGNAFFRTSVWPLVETMAADASDDADGTSNDGLDGAGANDGARDGQMDGIDDQTSRDGPKDGDNIPLCDALQADWWAFVAQNRDCSGAGDCVVVAGAGSCECSPSWNPRLGHPIGAGSGDAISASAQGNAQTYLTQWGDLDCNLLDRYCIVDAGPAKNLRCDQGKCTADPGSCFLPPPMPEPCR
jgi:hypothetical protein